MRDDRVYHVRLDNTDSLHIEQEQTLFMSSVFELARASGLLGQGLEITLMDETTDTVD